jgi:hypothetical protein
MSNQLIVIHFNKITTIEKINDLINVFGKQQKQFFVPYIAGGNYNQSGWNPFYEVHQ